MSLALPGGRARRAGRTKSTINQCPLLSTLLNQKLNVTREKVEAFGELETSLRSAVREQETAIRDRDGVAGARTEDSQEGAGGAGHQDDAGRREERQQNLHTDKSDCRSRGDLTIILMLHFARLRGLPKRLDLRWVCIGFKKSTRRILVHNALLGNLLFSIDSITWSRRWQG